MNGGGVTVRMSPDDDAVIAAVNREASGRQGLNCYHGRTRGKASYTLIYDPNRRSSRHIIQPLRRRVEKRYCRDTATLSAPAKQANQPIGRSIQRALR